MLPLVATAGPILASHHPVDASTGYMADTRGNWQVQIEAAREISPFAVELSVLSQDEIDGLAAYLASEPRIPFRYVSVHGPSKGITSDDAELVDRLLHVSRHAQAVVMHPDTIRNYEPYRRLARKLVLENMDSRKRYGRNAREMAEVFDQLPDAGFCFDVAHAWSIDPTMTAGHELLDEFRSRLRHVHVSSLSEDLHHVPLSEEHEELFTPVLRRCTDVPWILEAPPRSR